MEFSVWSLCCRAQVLWDLLSLTCHNAVDDRLVNALISVHRIDGTRTQDERGWLWR